VYSATDSQGRSLISMIECFTAEALYTESKTSQSVNDRRAVGVHSVIVFRSVGDGSFADFFNFYRKLFNIKSARNNLIEFLRTILGR